MRSKVQTLNKEFSGHLESLNRVYPMYKLNPDSSVYKKSFLTAQANIEKANGGLHSIQMQARDKIATLNRSIKMMDNQIDDLTNTNKKLNKRNITLTDARESAVAQAQNYTSIYRFHIFSAAALFGAGAAMVAKMF